MNRHYLNSVKINTSNVGEGISSPSMATRETKTTPLQTIVTQYEQDLFQHAPYGDGMPPESIPSYWQILDYLSKKGGNRKNYRHYVTGKRVQEILDGSAFFLTDGSSWNDKYDKRKFNPEFWDYKRFGICLSAATTESIAMWMLYGGLDGNGAMINFDRSTLRAAMSQEDYECGHFVNGKFEAVTTLSRHDIDFRLVDVLYFSDVRSDGSRTIERVGDDKKVIISSDAFTHIEQIAKHEAWAYETEVRLVATVRKDALQGNISDNFAIKMPISVSDSFVRNRVFDSPVATKRGGFHDSALLGTVDWDLCSQCEFKKK